MGSRLDMLRGDIDEAIAQADNGEMCPSEEVFQRLRQRNVDAAHNYDSPRKVEAVAVLRVLHGARDLENLALEDELIRRDRTNAATENVCLCGRCYDFWRERVGIEPTQDGVTAPDSVLKTGQATRPDPPPCLFSSIPHACSRVQQERASCRVVSISTMKSS